MEMDISYSAFASSSSFLMYDFEEVFPSSEGSTTPANSPTFYKCGGQSSRLSDMRPVFHSPSTSNSYKIWWDNSFCSEKSYMSSSPCEETGVWKDVEMEFVATSYGSLYHRRSQLDAAMSWPTRDNTVSCSSPVSVARSSLSCQQPSQTCGADWRGSPLEDDLFGPASPFSLTSASSFQGARDIGDPSMVGPQLLPNYLYNPTGSPYHHRPSVSSQPVPIVLPITITPPSSPPSSPASASSYSSVSSTSSSSPPTPPTPVLLPELRQPRPARPIPIIPLSKLATACEKLYMPSSKSRSVFSMPRCSFGASDLLPHVH